MSIVKEKGIFKLVSLFGALLMLIGVFPNYMTGLVSLKDLSGDRNLFQITPIFAGIIILTAVLIIVGFFVCKEILSLIGAGAGFIFNIAFPILVKMPAIYGKITGTGDAVNSIGGALGGALGSSASDLVDDSVKETIKESVKCTTGFYIILIGSLIALAMIIVDIVRKKH